MNVGDLLLRILLCVPIVVSKAKSEEEDLMDHLFNFTHYNKRVRPLLEEHRPVIVKHGIILTELSDINEKQQKMIVNVLQKIEWKDELLNWDPADYGGQTYVNVDLSKFWAPRLLLYNNADEDYPINRDNTDASVLLTHDGNITWILPGILKSSCKINVQYFPLDEQFCSLSIGSWTYGVDKLDIYPSSNRVDMTMYSMNGQWELMETWAKRETLCHACCQKEVAQIVYYIHIRRLPLFYIQNFILPCALIAALAAMVFLTPAETGEQLAVGVTILLALVVFFLMVETSVPNTSDHLPLIVKYYCCTVVEISLLLAVTCVIHKFEHHAAVPLPSWVKKYIIGYMGKIVCMKFASKGIDTNATAINDGDEKENDKNEDGIPRRNTWTKRDTVGNIFALNRGHSPFDGNVHLEAISKSMKDDQESEELEMQWKHAANILTRFMTFVYIFVITVTFFGIIWARTEQGKIYPED